MLACPSIWSIKMNKKCFLGHSFGMNQRWHLMEGHWGKLALLVLVLLGRLPRSPICGWLWRAVGSVCLVSRGELHHQGWGRRSYWVLLGSTGGEGKGHWWLMQSPRIKEKGQGTKTHGVLRSSSHLGSDECKKSKRQRGFATFSSHCLIFIVPMNPDPKFSLEFASFLLWETFLF